MQGALFCSPEKLSLSSFWGNPAVTRNNKPITKSNFPVLAQVLNTVGDFFEAGTNQICSKISLEVKIGSIIHENTYTEIKYIIKSSLEKLGLQPERLPVVELPYQPLLVNVATITLTGCSSYYKLIRKKQNLTFSQSEREAKWHLELNKTYGVPFWNKCYSSTANIKNDNKIKWMQYQIVRNSQFTNYRVHKFKPNVSPLCYYCGEFDEKLSHLYFLCGKVRDLWLEIKNFLAQFSINIPLDITTIIFGYGKEPPESKINFAILVAKRYIWTNKFNTTPLSFNAFKNVFKSKLTELKDMLEYKDELVKFGEWQPLYDVI